MKNPIVQYETRAGEPVEGSGFRIIPFARVLILRLPGLPGGLIWNRPASVAVQYADGREEILPVHDITRQAQITLLLAGLAGGLLLALAARSRNRNRK